MKLEFFKQRENWQNICDNSGFSYHSSDNEYWVESEALVFKESEIKKIEKATIDVHEMSLELVGQIIKSGDYQFFNLASLQKKEIERSWIEKDFQLMGRFDMSIALDGTPKMLEYNAETPTTFLECALIQKDWATEKNNYKTFNTLESDLIEAWKNYQDTKYNSNEIVVVAYEPAIEDWESANYMSRIIAKAGKKTKVVHLDDLEIDYATAEFFVKNGDKINNLYKIYPWEYLWEDDYSSLLTENMNVIEPAWKNLLSNKVFMALLWKEFKGHPNLLETYVDIESISNFKNGFVIKPVQGREGNNIKIYKDNELEFFTGGVYGEQMVIYQERCDASLFNNNYYNIGSWVVGNKASGIGIRKDTGMIIKNISLFVPHLYTSD